MWQAMSDVLKYLKTLNRLSYYRANVTLFFG